jgi:hypothetical protein
MQLHVSNDEEFFSWVFGTISILVRAALQPGRDT